MVMLMIMVMVVVMIMLMVMVMPGVGGGELRKWQVAEATYNHAPHAWLVGSVRLVGFVEFMVLIWFV
jgi:hypothetical protein